MRTVATLASSCSTFLEGDALRVHGSACEGSGRRRSGVARCGQGSSEAAKAGVVSRRQAAFALVAGGLVLPVAPMARALLEADDDDSLLEKVKEDKRKRIQKRSTAINDFVKESGNDLPLTPTSCLNHVTGEDPFGIICRTFCSGRNQNSVMRCFHRS